VIWLNSNFSQPFEFKSDNPNGQTILEQLTTFKHVIGVEMFSFLPFSFNPQPKGGLKELASLSFNEFKQMASVDFSGFEEVKQKGLERMAFSVLVNRFFTKDFPQNFKTAPSKTKDFIFFVKQADWTLAKKAKVDSPKEDILFALSGSMETLQMKTAQLSTSKWNDFQTKLSAFEPKRTGFSNISKVFNDIKTIDFNSFSSNSLVLREYAFYTLLNKAGFPPFITREEVSMVYPQLKVAKPRGRISKK
jgi:hypothetical protein